MLPWKKELELFFKQHEAKLCDFYPGLSFSRLEILIQDLFPFNHASAYLSLNNTYGKLLQGIPLEYIVGEKYFYRSPFWVNPHVLIPRNETEILVEKAVHFLKQNAKAQQVIDVGTGSGAIALSVLMDTKRPLTMTMTDYSLKALEVAKSNLERHSYQIPQESKTTFYFADRLNGFGPDSFDLILTNPPYIHAKQDFSKVHAMTHAYEPRMALYLDDAVYEKWFSDFFDQIKLTLRAGGLCLMEGHEDHLQKLQRWALTRGFVTVDTIDDYNGLKRFLAIRK